MKEEKETITEDDDFVMIERNGQILSGGFHVNSILLKNKKSPMYTLNNNFSGGSNEVSDIFKDLAVPAGIFFQPSKGGGHREESNSIIEKREVDDDLYDKLVKLATTTNNIERKSKNKTKKHNKKVSTIARSKKTTAKILQKKM